MSDLDTGPRVFCSHHSCIFLCLCCWLKSRRSSWLKGTKPLSNTWLGSVLPATKPCLWAQTDFQLWISRGERHRFPQWHSHFSIWLITCQMFYLQLESSISSMTQEAEDVRPRHDLPSGQWHRVRGCAGMSWLWCVRPELALLHLSSYL